MRMLIVILAVVVLAATGTAMAADVPSNTLGEMGIRAMQPISDADGMAIRGKAGQANFESMHRVVQLYKFQENLIKATPTTFGALSGNAVQSNSAKVNGGEFTGAGPDFQSSWVQLQYEQTNEINDQGVGQPSLKAIAQGNEIKAKTNDYAVSGVTPGPGIGVSQANTVKSGFSGIVVGGGLTQWNSFDAKGFGLGGAAFVGQVNTSTFTRSNISGVQQNRTIVR